MWIFGPRCMAAMEECFEDFAGSQESGAKSGAKDIGASGDSFGISVPPKLGRSVLFRIWQNSDREMEDTGGFCECQV